MARTCVVPCLDACMLRATEQRVDQLRLSKRFVTYGCLVTRFCTTIVHACCTRPAIKHSALAVSSSHTRAAQFGKICRCLSEKISSSPLCVRYRYRPSTIDNIPYLYTSSCENIYITRENLLTWPVAKVMARTNGRHFLAGGCQIATSAFDRYVLKKILISCVGQFGVVGSSCCT